VNTFLRLHALYYLVTGIWALVSLSTFTLAVGDFHTGNEYEVHTISAAALALGVVFILASRYHKPNREIVLTASLVALAVASVEIAYLPSRGWSLHWLNVVENVFAAGYFGYYSSRLF